MIHVVLPVPTYEATRRALAPRPASLRGAQLGFLDGWGDRTPEGSIVMFPLMDAIAKLATRHWEIAGTVWIKKDRAGSPASLDQLATMVDRCAAVVTGTCLSGGCTAGAIADATALEIRGVPTVTLCQENFVPLARSLAEAAGFPDLPLLIYPVPGQGNRADNPEETIRARFDAIERALLGGGY